MKRWLRWRGGPWRRRRAAVVGLSLKYRPVIKAKPNNGATGYSCVRKYVSRRLKVFIKTHLEP